MQIWISSLRCFDLEWIEWRAEGGIGNFYHEFVDFWDLNGNVNKSMKYFFMSINDNLQTFREENESSELQWHFYTEKSEKVHFIP